MNKIYSIKKSLCLFCLVFFCVIDINYSQELNFQETVEYIRYKLNINSSDKVLIIADEYGNMKITYVFKSNNQIVKYNLNDIDNIKYDYKDNQYYYCVRIYCNLGSCINVDYYADGTWTDKKKYWSFCNNSESDAEALVKAFYHLKSLIKKDPFK